MWMTAGIMAILLVGVAAAPVLAHHSFAMYDMTIEKTMTGKLKRFIVGANHSQFVMEVLNPDGSAQLDKEGKPVVWTVETTAASQLQRQNITVETFKVGTVFTISFSPLRDGRMGGAQRGAGLIMCGTKIPDGGCNEKTGKKY
jgi:hypothetical protein